MRLPALLLLITATLGCASVGPRTIPRDQFDYNAAIARSSSEQLLLNLVRLRYSETPVFLKVNSVISTYSRAATASAGVGANASVADNNVATLGGGVVWSDRPTITYTPLSGQEFSQNLLTPIPPSALFELLQSGWPAELVLHTTTMSLNSIENRITRPVRRRQADPELFELFEVWRRLREAGVIGVRRKSDQSEGAVFVLFLRDTGPAAGLEPELARFRELLDLPRDAREFRLVYGLLPERPGDIAVLTGSIWDIMVDMAWQFDVPPEHLASGRTEERFRSARPEDSTPIQVRFSLEEPVDAYVAVQEHGYWFYIDQNDRQSKRVFSFLQMMLNLAETGGTDKSPVVTISN